VSIVDRRNQEVVLYWLFNGLSYK